MSVICRLALRFVEFASYNGILREGNDAEVGVWLKLVDELDKEGLHTDEIPDFNAQRWIHDQADV